MASSTKIRSFLMEDILKHKGPTSPKRSSSPSPRNRSSPPTLSPSSILMGHHHHPLSRGRPLMPGHHHPLGSTMTTHLLSPNASHTSWDDASSLGSSFSPGLNPVQHHHHPSSSSSSSGRPLKRSLSPDFCPSPEEEEEDDDDESCSNISVDDHDSHHHLASSSSNNKKGDHTPSNDVTHGRIKRDKEQDTPATSDDSPLGQLFALSNKRFDEDSNKGEDDDGLTSGSSHSSSCKKKRKSRTAFTNTQIYELEKRFIYQKYLSPADRDEIAGSLGLSGAQVITWFQNRRAKMKRDVEEIKKDMEATKMSYGPSSSPMDMMGPSGATGPMAFFPVPSLAESFAISKKAAEIRAFMRMNHHLPA